MSLLFSFPPYISTNLKGYKILLEFYTFLSARTAFTCLKIRNEIFVPGQPTYTDLLKKLENYKPPKNKINIENIKSIIRIAIKIRKQIPDDYKLISEFHMVRYMSMNKSFYTLDLIANQYKYKNGTNKFEEFDEYNNPVTNLRDIAEGDSDQLIKERIKNEIRNIVDNLKLIINDMLSMEPYIFINFSGVRWFEANLSAVVAALIDHACTEHQNDVASIIPLNAEGKVKEILGRNGFLPYYHLMTKTYDERYTVIKLQVLSLDDPKEILKSIMNELQPLILVRGIDESCFAPLKRNISEICENAKNHGGSKKIYICGQFFPQNNRLNLTFVNIGKTFYNNVSEMIDNKIGYPNAIEWALEEGHTTKKGSIPGGLGLFELLNNIKNTNSKIQFISDKGYLQFGKRKSKHLLSFGFPGTIITIIYNFEHLTKRLIYNIPEQSYIF